jgi:hypothetical protein
MGQRRGEGCTTAKFTEEIVIAIRKDPRPPRDIAREHMVTSTYIRRIKLGKEWSHITTPAVINDEKVVPVPKTIHTKPTLAYDELE